ncbi:MAG: GH92 family glycosyl hydrolase [Bacteroidales bacterium]
MKKLIILVGFTALCCYSCQEKNPVDYVNPFIGTGGHGHTYPGATVPFGMVQLSPDTRLEGWDGCSGYHYSDSIIYGFSHTHLSGTGIADYCDILLMPTTDKYYLNNGYKGDISKGYGSLYSKKTEKAKPGYYSVILDDGDIKVELTTSPRVGFHKYRFPYNKKAFVTIDLTHRDEVLESSLKQINEFEIEGMRRSRDWSKDQYIYFVARFNEPIKNLNLAINGTVRSELKEAYDKNIKTGIDFGILNNKELLVKVGISAVSCEGARKNLESEIPHWDFATIKEEAYESWNKELTKINIKASSVNKIIFYTALYHTMVVPNLFMDVDGKYRGTDLQIHQAEEFTNYSVFSLWDTYRAAHPLYTIIDQTRTTDFIKTFIHQYNNGGRLPVWELAGYETNCMIGYHSVPVIADAYVKGIRDFDSGKALEAMKHSAMLDHFGLESYKKYGFIPADKESESVSKTLEYAYDDWCIAQMARSLGKNEDYIYFTKRAQSFKNLYDPSTGFMRAKMFGAWKHPFDPAEVDFNYTEANSWQYSFYVPQDVSGLMNLMGGKEAFAAKLDELFNISTETKGREQADITGLIGQYAHGNEPSHHMAYLYNFANQPWKTQEMVQKIMKEMYSTNADGLIGNEDCGQMSAWYVLNAMGFYPVTPASDIYIIGSPAINEANINLESGKTFTIKAKNLSEKNIYIQSATLNGENYTKTYIKHETIMNGGELIFVMGDKPNKNWGSNDTDIPVTSINEHLIMPVPFSNSTSRSFNKSTTVELYSNVSEAKIYYTLNNENPITESIQYLNPIVIEKNTIIKYFAHLDGQPPSNTVELSLVKFPEGRSIEIKNPPHPQYTGGSDSALIDGIVGDIDFRLGSWQSYYGVDLDAIIDLGKTTSVSYLSANFLQDINSWIFMPAYVEFFSSNDGIDFKFLGKVDNTVDENNWSAIIKEFTLKISPIKTRYIKVIGKSKIMCPDWHKGAGNKLHIFTDEITIK